MSAWPLVKPVRVLPTVRPCFSCQPTWWFPLPLCCVVLHSANPGHEDLFLAGSRASGLNVDVCARGFAPCSWRCCGCSTVVLMGFACPATTVVTVAAETQCESMRSTAAQHAVLYAHCYVGPPSPSIETTLGIHVFGRPPVQLSTAWSHHRLLPHMVSQSARLC